MKVQARKDDRCTRHPRQIEKIMSKPTVSVEDAARVLGLGRGLAYQGVNRGEIRSIKIGNIVEVRTARAESGSANAVLETLAWPCLDHPKEMHPTGTGASQPIPGPAGDPRITRPIEVLAY